MCQILPLARYRARACVCHIEGCLREGKFELVWDEETNSKKPEGHFDNNAISLCGPNSHINQRAQVKSDSQNGEPRIEQELQTCHSDLNHIQITG